MAYQVMYRTYRPQTFEEVVGQKVIIKTLKNALKEDKISHAYLFCGPRGTGKTTLARLFAKALNCQEEYGNICNKCASCDSISKGENPDVIEIDAASNSGVDSVRDLIEQVNYPPIMSRKKVYIIDEVHNMSNAAFNALLKTLEEPPEYCVFVLATTEPNKLLPTILSRVQRFDFSKISDDELVENMKKILEKENVKYEEQALYLIASLSDGGVRDSLSLLDQAVSYTDRMIKVNDIYSLFGLLNVDRKMEYIKLIHDSDLNNLLKTINNDYKNGLDVIRFHDEMIKMYKDYLIYYLTKDESLLTILNKKQINSLPLSLSEINFNLKYLSNTKLEYKRVNSPFEHFQMSLIYLVSNNLIASQVQEVRPQQPTFEPAKQQEVKVQQERKPQVVEAKQPEPTLESSISTSATLEEPKVADVEINYNLEDILFLMHHNKKEETKLVSEQYLNSFKISSNKMKMMSIFNAFSSTSVRIKYKNFFILVTNSKSNKITLQKNIEKITNYIDEIFKIKSQVYILTDDEFNNFYAPKYKEFKSENKLNSLTFSAALFEEEKVQKETKTEKEPELTPVEIFANDLFGDEE